jgi:hypothetical protein
LQRIAKIGAVRTLCESDGFAMLLAELQSRIHEFRPYNLATISWSMAKLSYCYLPLINSLAAESIPRIADFDTRRFARIAWAFARIVVVDQPLLDSI